MAWIVGFHETNETAATFIKQQLGGAITQMRAIELLREPVEFIASGEFAEAGADDRILKDARAAAPYKPDSGPTRVPDKLPAYLQQLFGLPLAYARGTLSGATNLGVFASFLDEQSFAARALGSIDLFILWWAISAAIGLGVLYRKPTTPIATTLISVYVAIGIIVAAIKTAVAGA